MAVKCILIAEDDASIRTGLADVLSAHGYGVLVAADGAEALALLMTQEVDLALLDVNMPHINGFKLLSLMAKECPGVPSIILTAHGEEKDRVRGLVGGADDYVVKPFSMAELLARIAAVLRRAPERRVSVCAHEPLRFPGGCLNAETHCADWEDGGSIPLREKEYELFYYLLSHPGRVISQAELLRRVWGSTGDSQTRTVAVTLARLREKLGPAVAGRIENVRGRGYKWTEL
ncbi:MAG: response regulator transcription factor [Akkermansiaceae bacterium]|nr:response regulator transcription factor [Akkermansiaceae bacterium]